MGVPFNRGTDTPSNSLRGRRSTRIARWKSLTSFYQYTYHSMFNILIDNTDDHEKNHALQVVAPTRQGRYRLAPAYDILSTNSGQGYQEFIVGVDQRDSTLSNAMSQCELFGYTPVQAAAEVARVIKVVNGWREHFASCGVTHSDLESLAQRIDGDPLLGQRVDPAGYTTVRKPKHRGPFAR